MVFNSIEFAIFLPAVFLLYWFVFNRNLKIQNLFIVIVSYIFYGWWDWRFLFLIAFTSFCSWSSGLLIDRYRNNSRKAKLVSAANIILNLAVLGVFKYYDFFASSFAKLFLGGKTDGLLLNIILPVGISFYTFQALSYSIDVYKHKLEPTRDIVEFFAFVSYFPQLVAGPIERATNLLPQFQKRRVFDYTQASDGMRQILWGLFKKIVVADNCAQYVDKIFSSCQYQDSSNLLIAAILFSFQIYGDFSGYSDIAIGTSKLFGIKLMRNFSVPYFSRDIAEFWRRWHISLTTWFRDYIYIPLGGSRCSKAEIVRNTFIIFLVSGLWHGANWTYVAWGGYHAILFLPLILFGKNRRYRDVAAQNTFLPKPKELFQILLTFFLVTIGWIIFRAESITQAGMLFGKIFSADTLPSLIKSAADPAAISCFKRLLLLILLEWLGRKQEHPLQLNRVPYEWAKWAISLAFMFIIFMYSATKSGAFIYFQF